MAGSAYRPSTNTSTTRASTYVPPMRWYSVRGRASSAASGADSGSAARRTPADDTTTSDARRRCRISAESTSGAGGERAAEILDEILRTLDAAAHADEVVRDPEPLAVAR